MLRGEVVKIVLVGVIGLGWGLRLVGTGFCVCACLPRGLAYVAQ